MIQVSEGHNYLPMVVIIFLCFTINEIIWHIFISSFQLHSDLKLQMPPYQGKVSIHNSRKMQPVVALW